MIVLSHLNGNQNVRAVLETLHRDGILQAYYTTLGFAQGELLLRLAPERLRRQLQRRAYKLPKAVMRRTPLREIVRLTALALTPGHPIVRAETGWASGEVVYAQLDATVARALARENAENQRLTGVYCYQDCALKTFQAARARGLKCFYDLPIAYSKTVQELLDAESERYPQWEFSMNNLRNPAKQERHQREIEGADAIYVPSRFVYDSLPQHIRDTKTCVISEFGSPDVSGQTPIPRDESLNKPLRVLFVGNLSQRKGLGDVFEAMKILNRRDVELTVLGSYSDSIERYKGFYRDFRYEATRPHSEVLQLMAQCDVFVFPSICEGRALVQQEALSQGLPLIVTKNAGAEDLIDEGQTGFLVPIRAPDVIAERLNWFADNRSQLPAMRELARQKAALYTWERYGHIIANSMADILKSR